MTASIFASPFRPAFRTALGAAAVLGVAVMPAPSIAQDEEAEARLRKVEAQIRALQRNVFPGGDGRFFEPQITQSNDPASPRQTGPSTTAVTDILARLDAIEIQLQRLTARGEETTNAISLLSERVDALEAAGTIVEEGPSLAGVDTLTAEEAAADEAEAEAEIVPATQSNLAAMGAGEPTASVQEAVQDGSGPTPDRLAAVQEITKPQTGDDGDDEYSYGFRLWNAGFYPEARQQLASFVEDYPDHYRATFGRNLLGRAFLDDGMAEEAARWFLRNYQADRTAARAPDSLLYLAESMIALGDTRRACIALAEFGETYPAVASGRLMDQYENDRRRVTCE